MKDMLDERRHLGRVDKTAVAIGTLTGALTFFLLAVSGDAAVTAGVAIAGAMKIGLIFGCTFWVIGKLVAWVIRA